MNMNLVWKDGMKFDAQIREHTTALDAKLEHGGKNEGPTPKELVLAGVCGCTGMDVVAILKKMRARRRRRPWP